MKKIYRQISPPLIVAFLFVALAAVITIFSLFSVRPSEAAPTPSQGEEILNPEEVPMSPPSGDPLAAVFISAGFTLALIPLAALVDKKTARRPEKAQKP